MTPCLGGTRLVLTALAAMSITAVSARAGEVAGVIDLPPGPPRSAGVDLYGKYESRADGAPSQNLQGVVFLKPLEDPATLQERATPTMDQHGVSFVPRVVPIQVGGRVRFLNSDPIFHNVFSLSPARKFDLGRYPKGDSRLVTFDRPGVVQVFCDIHAEMNGFVVVLESPYYAVLDPSGKYRMADVPPGAYEVGVWAEGMAHFQTVGQVEVPISGDAEFTASLLERR